MAISLGNMWHGASDVRRRGTHCMKSPQAGLLWLSTISLSLGKERKTNLPTLRLACTPCSKVLLCRRDGKSCLSAKCSPFSIFLTLQLSNVIQLPCNNTAVLKAYSCIIVLRQRQRWCWYCSLCFYLHLWGRSKKLCTTHSFTSYISQGQCLVL